MGSFPRTPFFFSSFLWRCWQVVLYASINIKCNVMHLNIIWKIYLFHCASPQSIQPSMHVLKVVNSQSADYDRIARDKISFQCIFLSHGELSSLQQRWNIPYSWGGGVLFRICLIKLLNLGFHVLKNLFWLA